MSLSSQRSRYDHPRAWSPVARSSRWSRYGCSLLAAAIVFGLATQRSQAETWTDLQSREIDAKMVGLWNGFVILEMDGNRRVKFPFNELRSDSRIQAEKVWETIKLSRLSRVEELQGQASAAAAPAPNPIPRPPAAPAYQPPLSGGDVAAFLRNLDQQLEAGHVMVIYDSLPPSYRTDINEFVQLAATKINPAAWQAATTGVHQLGDLLVTRQNWFFSNPRVLALPADQYDSIRQRLLLVGGMLREGFHPEKMQLTQLQSTDFGQWLNERDQVIAPYVAGLVDLSTPRQFNVVSESADKAKVKITSGGQEREIEFLNVDGYWVPKSFADSWSERITSLKEAAANAAPGQYMPEISALVGLQPMLMSLASAGDEGRFHSTMSTTMDGLRPILTNVAGTFGMDMSLASNTRRGGQPGYGGGGYGDEGEGYGDEGEGYGDTPYGEEEEEMMEEGDGYGGGSYEEEMQRRGQGR